MINQLMGECQRRSNTGFLISKFLYTIIRDNFIQRSAGSNFSFLVAAAGISR